MSDREQELKLGVASEEDWLALCDVLPESLGAVEQVNSYWDHPDRRLTQSNVMLRVRIEEPRGFITVKRQALRDESGFFDASEEEQEVPIGLARSVVESTRSLEVIEAEPLRRLAEEFGDLSEYRSWGMTRNLRRKFRLDSNLVVELDSTDFGSGRIYYEIEIESADPVRARGMLQPYLDRIGISVEPSRMTKSERLQSLKESEQ